VGVRSDLDLRYTNFHHHHVKLPDAGHGHGALVPCRSRLRDWYLLRDDDPPHGPTGTTSRAPRHRALMATHQRSSADPTAYRASPRYPKRTPHSNSPICYPTSGLRR
jgi:hypothetical protein